MIVSRFQGRTPSGWGGSWTTPRRGSTWRRSSRGRSRSSAEVPHSHQVGGDVRRQIRCVALTAESDGGISPNLMRRLILTEAPSLGQIYGPSVDSSGQASSIYADYIWSQMLRCKLINLSMWFFFWKNYTALPGRKAYGVFTCSIMIRARALIFSSPGSGLVIHQRFFELPERAPVFISDIRIMSISWLIKSD